MIKHFTATAFIVHKNKVLLIYHKHLRSWLPPGGHIEENGLPHEAASREVREETGLEIEFIETNKCIGINCNSATELPHPFICLEEHTPNHREHGTHKHIDLIFLAKPKQLPEKLETTEEDIKWFSLEEINKLEEKDILEDCKKICLSILKN